MQQRNILVTGGAKRIGAAIVERLANDGHGVVIHCHHSRSEAEALAQHIVGAGGRAAVVEGDLSDLRQTRSIVTRARSAIGGVIDGLVNSASAFEFDRPDEIDPELTVRLYSVNCVAPNLLASAVAAQRDVVDGSIVNVLDQKLANPNPDFFSYTLAKYALSGSSMLLSQAFDDRIAVNAVAPGLTLPSGNQCDDAFAQVSARNLLERPVTPALVADAVAFLLTSRGITGQTVHVDCGQRFLPRKSDVMFERRKGHDG